MGDLMLEGDQSVVIDAAAVEILDASGAEALALCHRRAQVAGRTLIWDGVDLGPRSSR
jgi:anti-anti-sigma regulatory factor